jgi:pantoate--beta-alanine ligase
VKTLNKRFAVSLFKHDVFRPFPNMQKVESISDMRSLAAQLKAKSGWLTLVPTMGALHEGHAVVVSIFTNPLAFGPNEPVSAYPKSLEADLALCESMGVDAVFMPTVEEIYPKGYSTYVTEEVVSKNLCGPSRPTHFRGVTTFMVKLLNVIHPDLAVFGQKDVQQVAIIRKMAADLGFNLELTVVPTVRAGDGLALGVRNQGMTPTMRGEALALSRALFRAKEMVASGVRSTDRVVAEATHILSQHRRVRIIYISTVDVTTMEPMREIVPDRTMLAIAAWVDEVRLIDNIIL